MLFLSSTVSMQVLPLTVNTITGERSLDIFVDRDVRGAEKLRHATLDLASQSLGQPANEDGSAVATL